MQTVNISLPAPLMQYVEEQVAIEEYDSVSEYMRDLVRADQKRKARAQLEQTLLDSLAQGEEQEGSAEF
jgi:antitoxin ParD1/3/4